ncbi:hypothetical protein HELRODRAFT_158299 [Helobdella robusta]|uniref:Uncharacterized protein n=1 Tax=Helobdella robusta TaxID=6412 RepID=T1EML8_HELRO|nr:hypothetical protein HELRODRAFT_158299 [Helobdella robusta]ESO11937.1 hypothetical protein HELRODRAFT_158299 [Helobdella robusta]
MRHFFQPCHLATIKQHIESAALEKASVTDVPTDVCRHMKFLTPAFEHSIVPLLPSIQISGYATDRCPFILKSIKKFDKLPNKSKCKSNKTNFQKIASFISTYSAYLTWHEICWGHRIALVRIPTQLPLNRINSARPDTEQLDGEARAVNLSDEINSL